MQIRSLVRAATAAAILGLVAPTVARAQSIWDLVTLGGATGYLGLSKTFTNGSLGSVTAYSTDSHYSIFAKNGGGVLGSEWGLGLCRQNSDKVACSTSQSQYDNEIGDWQNVGIILNLSGLNALNAQMVGFTLASAQANESWKVSYQTTATCNGSTNTGWGSSYSGSNPNRGSNYFDQATTGYNCLFFQPVWSQTPVVQGSCRYWNENHTYCYQYNYTGGNWEADGNYLVQSIATEKPGEGTSTTVPEPASMTLLATGLVGMAAAARQRRNKK